MCSVCVRGLTSMVTCKVLCISAVSLQAKDPEEGGKVREI